MLQVMFFNPRFELYTHSNHDLLGENWKIVSVVLLVTSQLATSTTCTSC
jgi:hypothetical protein